MPTLAILQLYRGVNKY